jgi:hypothetical protein
MWLTLKETGETLEVDPRNVKSVCGSGKRTGAKVVLHEVERVKRTGAVVHKSLFVTESPRTVAKRVNEERT